MLPGQEYQSGSIRYSILKLYPKLSKLYNYHDEQASNIIDLMEKSKRSMGMTKVKRYKPQSSFDDSIRRTKTVISDLVIANEFDSFATFTFNGKKRYSKMYGYAVTDRSNPDECKKKMSKWLKNQREIHGSFNYLIVPEYHKDGQSIHFHAMLKNYKGNLTDTGKKRYQIPIYNIESYKLGHSTLVPIAQTSSDIHRVGSYLKKYITKDMPMFKGKKRYWCSNGLIRPEIHHNPILDPWQQEKLSKVYKRNNIEIQEADSKLTPHKYIDESKILPRLPSPAKLPIQQHLI